MKIILLKSYANLGQVGEIVNVKPGFARNFLIPNKIASLATEQNIKALEVFLKSQETKEAKNRDNLQALSKKLNSLTLKFFFTSSISSLKQKNSYFSESNFFNAHS